MAYRSNPFLERVSERTVSEQNFVRLFSPKILERIDDAAFRDGTHVFRSPPGGGKTTLLRAFTPRALQAFWTSRRSPELKEAYQRLEHHGIVNTEGPQTLGIFLTCASGYTDLPGGALYHADGLFRTLFNCRVILRTLRSLEAFLNLRSLNDLSRVTIEIIEGSGNLTEIPIAESALDLLQWAETTERQVYSQFDSFSPANNPEIHLHTHFAAVPWLQSTSFRMNEKLVAPRRMLLIDDLHKLRSKQRRQLIEEVSEIRPYFPIWMAERSIALGEQLLSQGLREDRDIHQYSLEKIWYDKPAQYALFAQNVLDRRLEAQKSVPAGNFRQHLAEHHATGRYSEKIKYGFTKLIDSLGRGYDNSRYSIWLEKIQQLSEAGSLQSLLNAYITRILMIRDLRKRQLSLDIAPLSEQDLESRGGSQVQAAAELFMHEELSIPYYFGIEKLCTLSTGNIDELLSLSASLYEALFAKHVVRNAELVLDPEEQEHFLKQAIKKRFEFIPKSHTEGTRAQRLIFSVGQFCRERTFKPSAPIAPGVTGVRLTNSELDEALRKDRKNLPQMRVLSRVLAESVAENLFVMRESAATQGREPGSVFYLNRALCAHFGLPLQFGGWQDVKVSELCVWMEKPRAKARNLLEFD